MNTVSRDAEDRIVRWLRALCIIATLILVTSLANSAASWRAKSYTEQRLEAVEAHWHDQKIRNDAQDKMNGIVEKELERNATRTTPNN